MSKNISNLSGRIGLKDNLFKQISENTLSDNPQDINEIAKKHNLGVSTLHGAESFYEFLRPSHREKKAFVCNGSACMCAGTQDKLKDKLKEKLGDDKVGEMFCLGHCYENHAFHYDGENYAGKDIEKIDQILKGEDIKQEKFFSKVLIRCGLQTKVLLVYPVWMELVFFLRVKCRTLFLSTAQITNLMKYFRKLFRSV